VIMDVFTRSIRGWQLSRSLDQFLTLAALQRAVASHSSKIQRSDQGVQYAATASELMTSVQLIGAVATLLVL